MFTQLQLGELTIDVTLKEIKNVHLSVHPPTGKVRLSAPSQTNLETLRLYAISRLPWIKKQQTKLRHQEREAPRQYLDRESHYFFGKRYLLRVTESDSPSTVLLRHREIEIVAKPGSSEKARQQLVHDWYRRELRKAARPYVLSWHTSLEVREPAIGIKKMRTKWGSCSPGQNRIWINLELAKKPPECLDYLILHETVHMLEPNHGFRFVTIMDQQMPQWRNYRDRLNALPIAHTDWGY